VVRPARLAGVGVFVLGGLLLFALGLFLIGDRQMAFATKFTVYTEFTKITGLQPGAIVRVSGAKAGSVTQIVPPSSPTEKFRVQLEVIEDLHQLVRTDSVATIETEGLMGGSYLGIGTGTDEAAPVAANATIAGKDPFDISDLMQQMGDSITKVNVTIDELKGGVQETVESIGTTVDNANTLITDVSDDLTQLVTAAAAITGDAAVIAEGIRSGKGSLGKFVNDDELYNRVSTITKQVDEIATGTKLVVEKAKDALDGLQSKDGPVQGMTADVAQTMGDARAAMAGFAENMEALKRNFLVRGFFNRRGFFDLAEMTPAQYRQGALTKRSDRRVVRVWRTADELFEPEPDHPENEQLSESGKAWLDSAIAPYLEHIASGVVIVEGYAQMGTLGEQYLRSRARGSAARAYLIEKFHLDPQTTGSIPLSADSADSPGNVPWDGVAVAVILPKAAFSPRK
jgi:phospholipid/cholesterol/gamma-HCH transport system substrate-binding protein